tara:strand:- start:493 stop:1197 length:705 start_codon:yes stop_codon:yes gene_type:complete
MLKTIEIIGPTASGKSSLCKELQSLEINNEQIFFWSSRRNIYNNYKKINFVCKIYINLKVIFFLIFFYIFFSKRIFSTKIYKKKFFFRIVKLFYVHLIDIEILKKSLPDNKYLILEPGPIMYFLQDYFYTKNNISKNEIKIFNKFFLKVDYIIHLEADLNLILKRLKLRRRGLSQRMRDINNENIKIVVKKSINEINNFIMNIEKSKIKIITIKNNKNLKVTKDNILNFLNLKI